MGAPFMLTDGDAAGMRTWVLVPAKPLHQGKSRLQACLTPCQRGELSARLLRHVLHVVGAVRELAGVVVVSRDEQVLALGRAAGAVAVREEGHGLNPALAQAGRVAVEQDADAVLVLPSDLPLLTPEDVRQVLEVGDAQGPGMVIAPSRDGGTNALLLRPPQAIGFAFGADSFRRHVELARGARLAVHVVNSPTLAMDVDVPADLAMLGLHYPNASSPHASR